MIEVLKKCDCCGQNLPEDSVFDSLTLSIGERVKVWQLCRPCAATFEGQIREKFSFPHGSKTREKLVVIG